VTNPPPAALTAYYGVPFRWVEENLTQQPAPGEALLIRMRQPLDTHGVEWVAGIDAETPWFGRRSGAFAYRFENIADFLLDEAGGWIRAWRHPDAATQLFDFVLLRGVIPRLLHLRGIPCLHASAVEWAGSAVAFMGPSGAGKSTVAAFLCSAGMGLIGDDVLPLRRAADSRRILAGPGLAEIRLHPASPQYHDLPVAPPGAGQTKGLYTPANAAWTPLPLARIYLLEPGAPADPRPMPASEALLALVRNSFWIDPRQTAALGNDLKYWAETARSIPVLSLGVDFSLAGLKIVQSQVAIPRFGTGNPRNLPVAVR
jgi:hypothetical protein